MDPEELRKLTPTERIKRLKELEEKRKKEIAEAAKLLEQAENDLQLEKFIKERQDDEEHRIEIKRPQAFEEIEPLEQKIDVEEIREGTDQAVQYTSKLEEVKRELYDIENRIQDGYVSQQEVERIYEIRDAMEQTQDQYMSTSSQIGKNLDVADRVLTKLKSLYKNDEPNLFP